MLRLRHGCEKDPRRHPHSRRAPACGLREATDEWDGQLGSSNGVGRCGISSAGVSDLLDERGGSYRALDGVATTIVHLGVHDHVVRLGGVDDWRTTRQVDTRRGRQLGDGSQPGREIYNDVMADSGAVSLAGDVDRQAKRGRLGHA